MLHCNPCERTFCFNVKTFELLEFEIYLVALMADTTWLEATALYCLTINNNNLTPPPVTTIWCCLPTDTFTINNKQSNINTVNHLQDTFC